VPSTSPTKNGLQPLRTPPPEEPVSEAAVVKGEAAVAGGAQSVKGHGFSRAINLANKKRASAPKDSPSRRIVSEEAVLKGEEAVVEGAQSVKGHGFSRAINLAIRKGL
jgi:hypothetical protein